MKKILLAAAATTIISSGVAFAGAEDMFYVKAHVGANMMTEEKDYKTGLKMKSETSPYLGFGVGYYLMDNLRTDLTFEHYFEPTMKKTGDSKGTKSVTANHKADLNALFVNGYVDLFDLSVAKVFAGAGLGAAQVSEKVKISSTTAGYNDSLNAKVKKQTNFAYALHVGASTEFAPGINGELSYSWKDFGKTKAGTKDVQNFSKTNYKGHHVGLGIRFDM